MYAQLDPDGAEVVDMHNPARLIRAIEVTKKSGRPFSSYAQKGPEII